MNPGHMIFKRMQRLQQGEEEVSAGPSWLPPGMRTDPSPKEAAGLYDPGRQSDEDYNARLEAQGADEDDLLEEALQRRRETAYKTIGVNINGQEVEIPIWDEDMTPEQAEGFARDRLEMGLSQFASDMELEAAQQANAKRLGYAEGTSNVPYQFPLNPFQKPTTSGFGSGVPTQRVISGIAGLTPYLGLITGPAATMITRWIQNMLNNGASKQQVQQAVQNYQQQAQQATDRGEEPPPMPTGSVSLDKPAPHAGVGIDPWGNPADPGEWWSDDFGRWSGGDEFGTTPGDYNLKGPGGAFGSQGLGSSGFGGTVGTRAGFTTAIGFGGPYGGGISAGDVSRFRGRAGYSHPYTEAQYNASPTHFGWNQGPGYQLGPGWTPRASYAQYLEGFHAPGTVGSSTGPGGAAAGGIGAPQGGVKTSLGHTPRRAEFAMGTSDVNPGLKLFHRKLLKKPKQKEQTK